MGTISKDNAKKWRVFGSIRTKLALMFVSTIAVVLILMNTFFLTASRDMIFTSKKASIENQARLIASNLTDTESILTIGGVEDVMTRLDVTGLTHVTVVGSSGNALYDSNEEDESVDPLFVTDNINKALDGYDVFFSKFSGSAFSSSAFMPVYNSDGLVVGAVYVHENDVVQGAILIGLQSTIKSISFVIAALSLLMLGFLIWTIMRRITSILKAIKSVREGEYNYKIHIRGSDELTLIGDEFNSLTSRLRETEEVRRRFVADASHELKTPLASIRLLTDSILQNERIDLDTAREFVTDIGNEAERLSRTTAKLMTLTRLDNNVTAARERVDIRHVVDNTLRMLRPLAQSYQIRLDAALDDGCYVFSTEDDIYQIVFNLVENAIKYNMPGGRVDVTLAHAPDGISLTVEDTGIGVPESDLPYIFDRFYRVDKARSREAGGSGLGLAIVRDTVRDNGGVISAERRETGGMRFIVQFPPAETPLNNT
ncbi:HAMP domain-containing sensor histidine kinase [Oscillospiraceae bacterium WX1]